MMMPIMPGNQQSGGVGSFANTGPGPMLMPPGAMGGFPTGKEEEGKERTGGGRDGSKPLIPTFLSVMVTMHALIFTTIHSPFSFPLLEA
jgi:hypothetical protein